MQGLIKALFVLLFLCASARSDNSQNITASLQLDGELASDLSAVLKCEYAKLCSGAIIP